MGSQGAVSRGALGERRRMVENSNDGQNIGS